uniref:hypothetical protein n=1 Tax=Polynucleobacter sp. TaxID=2029855 RepID=UPI00404789FA
SGTETSVNFVPENTNFSQFNPTYGNMNYVNKSSAKRIPKKTYKKPSTSLKKAVSMALEKKSETKFAQNTTVETNATNSFNYFFSPPAISQGTRTNQRVGNKILLKGFMYDFKFNNNGTTVSSNAWVRVLCLQVDGGVYKTDSAITAKIFEPLATGGQDITTFNDKRDLQLKVNREGLKVLADDTVCITASVTNSTWSGIASVRRYVRTNIKFYYGDDTTEQPSNTRIVCVVMPRDSANDGTVFNIETTITQHMYFKDI